MTLYVIVSPKVDPRDLSDQTDVLEEVMVDYTDLLQLTLKHWHQFGDLPEDLESIRASMEHHLATYATRRLQNYEHMQELVCLLTETVTKFHEELKGQSARIVEKYGIDVSIHLSRFLSKDALLRIETEL